MKHSDEGMGLFVVVYAIAMIGGLAMFVLPVVWANGDRVYENPGVAAARLPGGPVRMTQRSDYPLANLQQQQIVSPAMLAELDASAKKQKPQRTARPSTSRSYAQVQDEPAEQRPARRSSFFSFF